MEGYFLQRLVGFCQKLSYLAGYALVDNGFGRTLGNAPRHLSQIACTDVELLCIESHVSITVKVVFNRVQELVVEFLATAVAVGMI